MHKTYIVYLIFLCTTLTVTGTAAQATVPYGDLQTCLAALSPNQPSFFKEQLQVMFAQDLGLSDKPITLTRYYTQREKILATLTFTVEGSTAQPERQMNLTLDGVAEADLHSLFINLADEFESRLRQSRLDAPANGTRKLRVSSGLRRPMTASEATGLFLALDATLSHQLDAHSFTDSLK